MIFLPFPVMTSISIFSIDFCLLFKWPNTNTDIKPDRCRDQYNCSQGLLYQKLDQLLPRLPRLTKQNSTQISECRALKAGWSLILLSVIPCKNFLKPSNWACTTQYPLFLCNVRAIRVENVLGTQKLSLLKWNSEVPLSNTQMGCSQFCEGCTVPTKHKCLINVSCYISIITLQLKKKNYFQTSLFRFNQAAPVKLHHVKEELFNHQMENQAKIYLNIKKLTENAHSEIKTH